MTIALLFLMFLLGVVVGAVVRDSERERERFEAMRHHPSAQARPVRWQERGDQ